MPFELANTKKEVVENWDWILVQEYKTGENQATEALFKWFFFSRARVQKRFLSRICGVPAKGIVWQRLTLQRRGKKGTPDAVLHLADNSQLLFEVKAKQNAVSREQLKRHLRDAGLKTKGTHKAKPPRLILVTPDFREPRKLKDLPEEYRARTEWVPWNEILNFLAKMATGDLNSCDQMLRNALVLFLKEVTGLKKYSP